MLVGKSLDNRYTILERIGGGGMADVYKAHDSLLDRHVAVKVLRSQFTGDDEFVQRFRREAQAAARLSHPNIVNIYDVGREDDIYYIVMEYIAGETLKERIQNNGPLPVEQVIHIARQISEALEHAHQNNLVHCDIKPHNILLTKTGRVKVTDFGIARAVTSTTMTQTGTVIGSVHYFSPEQAKGSFAGPKSDLYSLGVVMYEMLTGKVPFTGESPISIALKHIQEEVTPPQELNPEIPPLLEAIVLKAMEKDVNKRYQSVSEMIHDLDLALNALRDGQTQRLTREDFPTQILPKVAVDEGQAAALPPRSIKAAKGPRSYWWILFAVLLFGFAFGSFLAFGQFWSLTEVEVPNVVGKSLTSARATLEAKGLRVNVAGETFNDRVPANYVISQSPQAGAMVKQSRTINLIVSKGGEIVVVPDVRGMERRDAELQLKNAGLAVGLVEEQYSSEAPANVVLNQNPKPPTQLGKNSAVDLVVSKGPVPRKFPLPDFRGSALTSVKTQLESLKLKLGTVTEAPSDQFPAGIIIGQNPLAGTEVEENTLVDLVVSKGGGGAIKRAAVQITVPEGPPKQSIQIIVTDTSGRRVVYDGLHKPGDRIDRTIEGAGTVKVQVYINGTLIQEQTL